MFGGAERATPLRTDFFVEIEISCRSTGNQSSPSTERQILERPLDKNQDAALKFDNIHQMYERPDKPRSSGWGPTRARHRARSKSSANQRRRSGSRIPRLLHLRAIRICPGDLRLSHRQGERERFSGDSIFYANRCRNLAGRKRAGSALIQQRLKEIENYAGQSASPLPVLISELALRTSPQIRPQQ